ncbi:hypothetical protein P3X46_007393 [Hevea brasiliensis]|uniref:K Homology domain-containing protein n=1 Tax=Hevea brasiliensis TaxID=3981 RepID=A0ABQ9MTC9_HEVBR|nr:uncharacterized protein LOC110667404 [Hevea brasiliensis]KAJ9183554.1 hypothetical protein P3X46_007393 [Hevea brasiliensis]
MADDSQYSSGADTTPIASNKRKYDDQTPPSSTRRPTGFSSPDSLHAPPSYNSVPPPTDEIQMAKQKAQEIAARLLSGAGADIKRPRVENGASGFDSNDKGFSSAPNDMKSLSNSAPSAIPVSYGSYLSGSSKKIDIPNGRVGVIIGKGGETIKYLQIQSGAKIQVTRDMDADPNSPTRMVELMGTPEQIAKAEQLINEVLAEAEAGGSGTVSKRFTGQGGSEHFAMKIPNNKVGLVIGKGGDTIKNMQARTGARIQVIPLHLPPGDTATERNVHIEGTSEQIEHAKQLVNEVISENRARNQSMAGGYPQQGYQTRPPTSWGPPGAPPMQQPGYGYMQPGAYPGPSSQYNMSQPPYAGYPPQPSSGGYPTNWDQSNVSVNQQTGQGYDYYNQPASSQPTPGGPAAPADNTSYNYSQPPASGYNQQGQGYVQDGYGGYPQSGYGQPPSYDQQGYTSAPSYGNVANASQEGHASSYGAQGDSAQAPSQPAAIGQQGYTTGQQPSPNPSSYTPQGSIQPGYGMTPNSQTGYGSQPPAQPGYGSNYGPPQAQKPPANPPVYGQTQQSPSTPGGYGQATPVQPGYPPSQPPPSGYTQSDSGPQRPPPSGFGASGSQPGYGPPYGSAPAGQSGYGQGMPPYNTSYGGGYSQPAAYSTDGNTGNNTRATYDTASAASQPVQQGGVAKTSPQS